MLALRNLLAVLLAMGLVLAVGNRAEGFSVLGGLVGSDLTDIGDNGVEGSYAPPNLAGFDAEFFSSDEPGFGGGEFAFNVFDNAPGGGNNKWCCGTDFPQTVGADFSTTLAADALGIVLTSFTLTSSNDTPGRDPRVWSIQGSNDTTDGFDGTWTTIFARTLTGSSDWGNDRNEVLRYSPADGDAFLTGQTFKAFRMETTATGLTSGAFFAISEIELFGDVIAPEPSTLAIWALLAVLGIGIGWRRR